MLALCSLMAAAALLEGTVAAVVLEPRLLLHTLVLLLSLEDWARHALANLIAVKHGMSRLFDVWHELAMLQHPHWPLGVLHGLLALPVAMASFGMQSACMRVLFASARKWEALDMPPGPTNPLSGRACPAAVWRKGVPAWPPRLPAVWALPLLHLVPCPVSHSILDE